MKKTFFFLLCLAGILPPASATYAQDGINSLIRNQNLSSNFASERTWEKVALSGKKSQLANFYCVNLNCSPCDWYEVRFARMPANGEARLVDRTVPIHYEKTNARSSCNGKTIRAKTLEYTPAKEFKGMDEFIVETITHTGEHRLITYNVNVR